MALRRQSPPALVVKDKWVTTIRRFVFLFSNNLIADHLTFLKTSIRQMVSVQTAIRSGVPLCSNETRPDGTGSHSKCRLLVLRDNHAKLAPPCWLFKRWKRPHFYHGVIHWIVLVCVCLSVCASLSGHPISETICKQRTLMDKQWFLYSMYLLS